MVKSTSGDTDAFNKQDGLYTVCVRGIDEGKTVEENCIISSVSRVLSASNEWNVVWKLQPIHRCRLLFQTLPR